MVKRGIISRREVVEIREGQTVGFGGAGNTLVLNLDCGCKHAPSFFLLWAPWRLQAGLGEAARAVCLYPLSG